MQRTRFRIAAALMLAVPALATSVAAQDNRNKGGPAAAPHVAPAAPAPHVAPAAPPPHIAAPAAPAPHIAAPAPHIAAPAPHVAAPTPHISAPARVAAPAHVATPHAPAPQLSRSTVGSAVAHQQQREERRLGHTATPPNVQPGRVAHEGARNRVNPTISAPKVTTPNPTVAAPNVTTPSRNARGRPVPNTTTPNVAGQPSNIRGRNAPTQQAQTQAQARAQARAQIYVPGKQPVLRNTALANLSTRDPATRALATATFRGRFTQFRDRFRDRFADRFFRRALVIGWVGPVFWPYAYADVVDYTLWPYATDTFWPYAYDDVYSGIFGDYAPDVAYGTAYASTGYGYGTTGYGGSSYSSYRGRRVARTTTGLPPAGSGEICTGQESQLTDWPIERIAQQVQPDDRQRPLLDKLKDATARAVEALQSACPTDLPSTPTGRLAAVRQRIQAMLQTVQIIRPPLESFYQSLSDEQKERFNALDSTSVATTSRPRSGGRQQPDLAQVCSSQTAQVTSVPINRISQALRLDQTQRSALENLNDASAKAADFLSRNCPQDASLTPPGRVAAMEQRLNAMLQALDTVQPALTSFYNSLSDEQKARFDRLPRQA
jgi:hypothetical protein